MHPTFRFSQLAQMLGLCVAACVISTSALAQGPGKSAGRTVAEQKMDSALIDLTRAAASGQVALAPSVAATLVTRTRVPARLTPREVEVLRLVAAGGTNGRIASVLSISEATVKTHLLRIFEKLGVNDRTRAVTLAMERGILS